MQPTPGADPRAPIAVIGAGSAGLACARQLQAAGRTVEVFECAAQPGGRLATWRADDGTQCDHGAQYFTAHTPDFLAVLGDLEKAGIIARWHPRLAAIDTTGPRAVHDATVRYVGSPDMAALPRHLAENLKLHLNLRVEACHHDGAHWTLTAAGVPQPKRYSSLLLALPAPQAAALIAASAPTFAAHARACPMHACWALIARHEDDPGVGFDAAFVNVGPLSWIARDSSKPQRPAGHTWLLHAPATPALDAQPPEVIARTLLAAFGEYTHATPAVAWTLHRWAYAHDTGNLRTGALWDAQRRLGLAGDWLHGGRVEGAWLSGTQLARAVLAPST